MEAKLTALEKKTRELMDTFGLTQIQVFEIFDMRYPPKKDYRKSMAYDTLPKRIRHFIFKRDKYTCHYCGIVGHIGGKKNDKERLCIDHKICQNKNGNHHIKNLVTTCNICNSKKATKDYSNFVRVKK